MDGAQIEVWIAERGEGERDVVEAELHPPRRPRQEGVELRDEGRRRHRRGRALVKWWRSEAILAFISRRETMASTIP